MPDVRRTRNRIAWWLAALLLNAAIALTYRLTRPPELVWWTSPPLGGTHYCLHMLVPFGWERAEVIPPFCVLTPVDHRPKWLRWLFHPDSERAALIVNVPETSAGGGLTSSSRWVVNPTGDLNLHGETFTGKSADGKLTVEVQYFRSNQTAFNSSSARMRSSLRIE